MTRMGRSWRVGRGRGREGVSEGWRGPEREQMQGREEGQVEEVKEV